MEAQSFIITLTGASGSGKTYITDRIIEFGQELYAEGIPFRPRRHWKYVTRPYRETEIIDKLKGREIDVVSVKNIPSDCEFVYRTYGDEYGFRKKDIQEYLKRNESPILVVNDIRVVEELKREFSGRVLSLFLFREIIPDLDTHKEMGRKRGGISESKIISRFEKAVALYRVFIENIHLFDRVILNVPYEGTNENGEKLEDIAKIQAEGIIRGVLDGKISLNKRIKTGSKLFIVSGNAQSGKDDIVRAAKKMGKLQADVLVKYTTRWEEDGDDGEIVCKYKRKQSLLDQFEQDYQNDLDEFSKYYTFERFKQEEGLALDVTFNAEKHDCSVDEYCRGKYEANRLMLLNQILTANERFWRDFNSEISKKTVDGELANSEYNAIIEAFFEYNAANYVDLEYLAQQNKYLYNNEIQKIKEQNKLIHGNKLAENNSGLIKYNNRNFVLYENNKKLYGMPIFYGCDIDNYTNHPKHLVLTASLPNIFRICRKCLGPENVVTAYTYSQISSEEHSRYSDQVVGVAKLQEYDDILRYAYHIVDFDYALIFAETSILNKSGNQKDELVDQMFRLFRVYSEEIERKKRYRLFVLSGPSGTGKSTILSKIVKSGLCHLVPKYSNRPERSNEFDDVISVDNIPDEVYSYGIVYEAYKNVYGIDTQRIKEKLSHNDQIVIVSDFDAIRKLRTLFQSHMMTILVSPETNVGGLFNTFIKRNRIKIEGELKCRILSLCDLISDNITNKGCQYSKHENELKMLLNNLFSLKLYDEFIGRYESLIATMARDDNNNLFDHKLSGDIETMYNELSRLINND